MKTKLFFLVLLCLGVCCAVVLMPKRRTISEDTPKLKITMVNFTNGLTSTLLDVGTTSFLFSVEWPLDMKLPIKLDLISKLNLNADVWHRASELELDPLKQKSVYESVGYEWDSRFPVTVDLAQRKAIFEFQFDWFVDIHKERDDYTNHVFFSVQTPDFIYDNTFYTREEIIHPDPPEVQESGRVWDMTREYAEVDLTGNGLKDIIISAPEYTRGKGGIGFSIYICIATNQYKELPHGIGGNLLAIEDVGWGDYKRIWGYWYLFGHLDAIQYVKIEKNGKSEEGPSIDVFMGSDGGPTTIGNAMVGAIFSNCLEFERTPAEAPPSAP